MRRFITAGFLLLFSWMLYSYTYQGFDAALAGVTNGTALYWLYWTAFAGVMFFSLRGLFGEHRFTKSFRVAIHVYVIILVSQLVLSVFLFGEDMYRLAYSFIYGQDGIAHIGRNPVVSQLGIALASVPFVSFIYGMVKGKYKYTVHRQTLYFDDLPAAFDGFTITQISDIHSGSFDNAEAVQRGINLINEQQSDLFVFTGDLVNNKASEIEPWIPFFSKIEAPFGKFSILGNHDYGDYVPWESIQEKSNNLRTLFKHHQSMGFRLLLDEHVTLEKEGEQIKLLGIENWGVGFGKRGDLNRALEGVNPSDFKVLLSHDPSHFTEEVQSHDTHIHLTLSGHTHGMQFGIEKFGIKWSPVKLRYKHWAGLLTHNNRHLYINRGFGFLGFEGRVGIWPEITVIELKKNQGISV